MVEGRAEEEVGVAQTKTQKASDVVSSIAWLALSFYIFAYFDVVDAVRLDHRANRFGCFVLLCGVVWVK